jgi:hypothetical protein
MAVERLRRAPGRQTRTVIAEHRESLAAPAMPSKSTAPQQAGSCMAGWVDCGGDVDLSPATTARAQLAARAPQTKQRCGIGIRPRGITLLHTPLVMFGRTVMCRGVAACSSDSCCAHSLGVGNGFGKADWARVVSYVRVHNGISGELLVKSLEQG